MITLVAIKTAINTALAPLNLDVYGGEIKEGFVRPCLFANLMPLKSETFKADTSENLVVVEIVYFSANKTDIENLQMYDLLKAIFTPILTIGTKNKLVRNFRAEVIDEQDHIYSVKFDLSFYDEIPDNTPPDEDMGTLNLNLGGYEYGIT